MPQRLRTAFNHLLVPLVVGGLWVLAEVQNNSPAKGYGSWRVGNVLHIGNPYDKTVTTVVLPEPGPADEQDDDGGGQDGSAPAPVRTPRGAISFADVSDLDDELDR